MTPRYSPDTTCSEATGARGAEGTPRSTTFPGAASEARTMTGMIDVLYELTASDVVEFFS